MNQLYNQKKKEFDKLIRNFFPQNSEFSEILNYSIDSGKRIRPIILLEVDKMIKDGETGNNDIAQDFAISLELIHNYSLVHDDLPAMDDDKYRRDRKTTHYKYGEDLGILAGDALLNYSYELLFKTLLDNNENHIIKAAQYLAKSSGHEGMILGQIYDRKDNLKNIEDIKLMYKNKTCRLIMAATTIPGYLNNLNDSQLYKLEELGYNIGMAFQLQDDLLDLDQDEQINKLTYIKYRGIDKTKEDILRYSNNAIKILKSFDHNEFLINLIKDLIERAY